MLPDLADRISFFKTSDHAAEHVTDKQLPHPTGEKHDIFLAYRSQIKHLPLWLTLQIFGEQLQDITGIVGGLWLSA